MNRFILFLKIFIFLVVVCLSAKSWHLFSDGFRIDKIKSDLKNLSLEDDHFSEVSHIFDQKFKYLSKGCQTYVFESEDNNYVVKFIRYHRYELPFWIKVFNFCDKYKNKRQNYKTKLLNESLNSYIAAYNHLKNETAVVYVHLNKTNHLNKSMQIIDRLHNKYLIDLDNTGFLVQKKVKSFSSILNKNINNEEELKRLTNLFLQTTKAIYLKGFNNDDYNCIKNSGYTGDQVIHSDVGSFLQKNLKGKEDFEKEFMHFVVHFKKWAKKNAPFLITYMDEEIKKISSELDHEKNIF